MFDSLNPFMGYQDISYNQQDKPSSAPQENLSTWTPTALVEEIPLSISVHDISYAVIMITPINIDAFLMGFLKSEGIIDHPRDIRDTSYQNAKTEQGLQSLNANIEISARRFSQFKQRRNAHLGATGCGLCGVESLHQAFPPLDRLPPCLPIDNTGLLNLRNTLEEHQDLGKKTGAIHAALLLSPEQKVLTCMEDIGRHNTLDKVIGYALKNDINLFQHSVLMSSRCSTELIQKAVRVGLSRLIHLASPSTSAVQLARHYNLTLIHLPKNDAPRTFSTPTPALEDSHHE